MSSTNPTIAIDAILESEQNIEELVVKPLTIARMALLELVDSPFLNLEKKFDMTNMYPSVYIVTAEIKELKGFNSSNVQQLLDKALEWSDTVDMSKMPHVIEEVLKKLNSIYKIAPGTGGVDDDKKKEQSLTTTAS